MFHLSHGLTQGFIFSWIQELTFGGNAAFFFGRKSLKCCEADQTIQKRDVLFCLVFFYDRVLFEDISPE